MSGIIESLQERVAALETRILRMENRPQPPLPLQSGPHANWEQAEERARMIHELRAQGKTHAAIARMLGLRRDLVTYYLSENCKARIRAGVVR